MDHNSASTEAQPLLSSPHLSRRSSENATPDLPDNGTSTSSPLSPEALRRIENDVLPENATFGRDMGWTSAYIVIISQVIGAGVFIVPGVLARSVGSVGLTFLLWIFGALLAACNLAVWLEYGCMLPRSGGQKVYLEFTYRKPRYLASVMITVQAVLLMFSSGNSVVFAEYLLFVLGVRYPTDLALKGVAVGFLTTVIVLHGCFRRIGIVVQNFLGWTKIGFQLFMLCTALYVVFFQPGKAAYTSRTDGGGDLRQSSLSHWDELWAGSQWNFGSMSAGTLKVLFSFSGLENLNYVMNEVKDPVRTLRSAAPTALVTACILYMLVNLAYFLVVPLDQIKESGEMIAALFLDRVFGHRIGGTILPIFVAISAAGGVMVGIFGQSRLKQEVARQGFLPFSRILSSSRPFNSPMGGLFLQWFISVIIVIAPPGRDVYSFVVDVQEYPNLFFVLAVSSGLIILRVRMPELRRPFKAWLPAVWLRIVLTIGLIIAAFVPPKDYRGDVGFFYATYALVGIGVLLFGVAYWYLWTVAIPRWKGYTLEDQAEVLSDGTSITRLVHVKNDGIE